MDSKIDYTQQEELTHGDNPNHVSEKATPLRSSREDNLTWREVFTWRVNLSILFLGIAYAQTIGFILFCSILVSEYQKSFGAASNATWIPISHITAATVVFSIWGRWSDIVGRRYVFLAANVFSVVGSVVGATASSSNQMIAAGVLSGIANGANQLSTAAMLELVPNQFKPYVMGFWALSGLPLQFAPLISGSFIADYGVGWKGCWWLMLAIAATTFIGLLLVYFPPKGEEMDQNEELKHGFKYELMHFDWFGVILLAGSLVSILLGLQWGGQQYPWDSARVITCIVVGGVGLVALAYWEYLSIPKIPLVSMELIKMGRAFVIPCTTIAFSAMGYYSMNIIWPIMISALFTTSARTASYYQMASPSATLAAAFVYAPIAKRVKHYRWQIVFWSLFQGAFTAAMAASDKDSRVMSTVFVCLIGVGLTGLQLNAQLCFTTQIPPRLL
ncbi:MFS general substrate transporter [Fonsecaea pedrosoi]|nr:MFS general substrate transporter [Fonsecaea pedrosoi]